MPDQLVDLKDLTITDTGPTLRETPFDGSWISILQQSCEFPPDIFEAVCLNLLKNPNINSSLLFRADILYDSKDGALTDTPLPADERSDLLQKFNIPIGGYGRFRVERTILRRMIPRNPQLDKPIIQTCLLLHSEEDIGGFQQTVVFQIPHCNSIDELPWYHPRVKALAYLHSWPMKAQDGCQMKGLLSLHYQFFDADSSEMSDRLMRTGQHLLSAIQKHGKGRMDGYTKRVHHDQIVSQSRVQNIYTDLKMRHSKRLCEKWVEKTEPSKHVFEDLGIAAFLIEMWKDMYNSSLGSNTALPAFPGFVDIGCGNGVLVEVLLKEGYHGWGFDARKRKTWSVLSEETQNHLQELLLIPQPFFEVERGSHGHQGHANAGILANLTRPGSANGNDGHLRPSSQLAWHNGIFAEGTFIISNHADELTAWTPLLASLSNSPFLAIPCCSHNLSGSRFRAPSHFNNYSADRLAPSYFAANISKSKSVAIAVARPDNNYGIEDDEEPDNSADTRHENTSADPNRPSQGDLKALSAKSRSKQPSAYSSLCEWVSYLSQQVGYEVEREMLRLPSTRNTGLICRTQNDEANNRDTQTRMNLVIDIAKQEGASAELWMSRAKGLMKDSCHECKH